MTPDDFRRLVAAGLSTDQIAVVMEMMDREAKAHAAADEARKAKGRDRVHRWREARNVTETQPKVTVLLTRANAPVEDKPLNQKIEPQKEEKKETRERASFDAFWGLYPHKVGKADASKAFDRAIRRTDFETMMDGLRRYAAKTDDRPWCNPSTWLNQDRWTDQPATVSPMARGSPLGRPPTAQELLKAQRESFANHDEPPPDRPYLIAAR